MKTDKKTTITFTADELKTMLEALTAYTAKAMTESDTWANIDAIRENKEDYFHTIAMKGLHLQVRIIESTDGFET